KGDPPEHPATVCSSTEPEIIIQEKHKRYQSDNAEIEVAVQKGIMDMRLAVVECGILIEETATAHKAIAPGRDSRKMLKKRLPVGYPHPHSIIGGGNIFDADHTLGNYR